MAKLFQLLKKHGLIPGDAAEDKLKEIEKDCDDVEISLTKPAAPAKPGDKPNDAPTVGLPPEVAADIESLKTTVGELASGFKVVVDATKAGQAERTAQEAAAQRKRYDDHVAKLVTEGRITKAQSDEYLKAENVDKNMKALDVFVETTGQFAVNPALKGAVKSTDSPDGARKAEEKPAGYSPNDAHAARKLLEEAALQEIADGMAGKL
jgi:hypothetical protein